MVDIEITNQYNGTLKRLKNVGCRCLHISMKSIRFGFGFGFAVAVAFGFCFRLECRLNANILVFTFGLLSIL